MSKSLGNVVNPIEYVEKYGTDALRYYLLAKVAPAEDSDFTKDKFEEAYQADLANGLGNLVARVAAMAQGLEQGISKEELGVTEQVAKLLDVYKFDSAMAIIWENVRKADQYVSENKVWTLKDESKIEALTKLVGDIRQIAVDLRPFLPETAEKIAKQFGAEKIVKGESLFPRLS